MTECLKFMEDQHVLMERRQRGLERTLTEIKQELITVKHEVTKMNTEPSGMSHILHMLDVQIGCITTDVEQPLRHASDSAGLSRLAHSL